MYHTVLIFFVLISGIRGQVPVKEKCPELTLQQNFDLNKYLGKWYEQATYPNKFELPGKCYDAEYTMLKNATVKVVNSQIVKESGKKTFIEGTARFAGKSTEGKLIVTFHIKGVTRDSPYWVLDTDYDSYAVVWSCSEMKIKEELTSLRFVWLLTRVRLPSSEIMNKIFSLLRILKIMLRILLVIFVSLFGVRGQAIIDGDCPVVTVVENFDIDKYSGRWYEHFTYPRPQEIQGKCNTADYWNNHNRTMGIRNTQLNQATGKLEYANGYARPLANPKEAKFLVNLDIGSHRDATYWILESDYTSYAVVWSCTPISDKSLAIVWLLSREKTLSGEVAVKLFNVLDKFNISLDPLKYTDQTNCPAF
ncbi:hypothetical protein WA026_003036 [Henosepilachna vigintioctopunctata]|uniref:Apolipoprotein D n=1 Tax=Henosepilachna vigintioctopunctata TaxID=420089 RepID=A0AAW1TLX5_9CUCU